jgi:hypothetical protein
MQMLWKSISTTFPFTIRGGNAGTNNEKRVSYSRLSTQEKESDVENSGDFYKISSSKSSHELTNNNTTMSPVSGHNQNGNSPSDKPTPVLMKHSLSMDWKLGTVLNSSSQKKSTLSTWRRKDNISPESNYTPSSTADKIENSSSSTQDKVNDLFQRVQSHSKFLSGVIFNDDCDASSDLDEEDKGFYCEVCERSFPTIKRLYNHQDRKRHFGCLQCDSIFPSRENLECHQEQMGHFDFVSDNGSDTTYDSDEEDLLQDDENCTSGINGNSFV